MTPAVLCGIWCGLLLVLATGVALVGAPWWVALIIAMAAVLSGTGCVYLNDRGRKDRQ